MEGLAVDGVLTQHLQTGMRAWAGCKLVSDVAGMYRLSLLSVSVFSMKQEGQLS